MQDKDNAQKVHLDILKTDLTTLKKSLTGLSAAILEIKGKLGSTYETDSKMAVLYTNITTIKTQLTTVKDLFSLQQGLLKQLELSKEKLLAQNNFNK